MKFKNFLIKDGQIIQYLNRKSPKIKSMSIQRVDSNMCKSKLSSFERNRNSLRISNIKRYSTILEKIKSKNNLFLLIKIKIKNFRLNSKYILKNNYKKRKRKRWV